MELSAKRVSVEDITPWRDLYREEMNCQIIHDSIDSRPGWTQPYMLQAGDTPVGYASIAHAGPWKDTPTIFQFYVLPQFRSLVFELFTVLLPTSGAVRIETQSNETLLTVMLHTFARDIQSESIIFRDGLTTAHQAIGAHFRQRVADDEARISSEKWSMGGDWVLESDGTIVGLGGIAYHYNRPYGDIFMEIADRFRQRGLGVYLVQELKRACYGQGSMPAARCNPNNIASRKTLQKAGFIPCGHILYGSIPK
jgi:GNAT superfamily N-acetyltransferase